MSNVFSPMNVLMAFGAGLASAVLFLSLNGGTLVALPLFLLTPLPIIIAALGWGTLVGIAAAAIAAVSAATALVWGVDAPSAGDAARIVVRGSFLAHAGAYLLSFGVPSLVVCHLLGLARRDDKSAEWYPLGRVVLAAGLLTAASAILGGALAGIDMAFVEARVREMVAAVMANPPGDDPRAAAQLEALVGWLTRMIALAYPIVWTAVLVFDLWLGAKVVAMSGRLARPWEDLAAFELPRGTGRAFLVAMLAEALPGTAGLLATVIAGALGAVLALVGMGVLHTVTRGSGARPIILASIYGLIFLFSLIPAAFLVVLGLAERVLKLRDRRRGGPPAAS